MNHRIESEISAAESERAQRYIEKLQQERQQNVEKYAKEIFDFWNQTFTKNVAWEEKRVKKEKDRFVQDQLLTKTNKSFKPSDVHYELSLLYCGSQVKYGTWRFGYIRYNDTVIGYMNYPSEELIPDKMPSRCCNTHMENVWEAFHREILDRVGEMVEARVRPLIFETASAHQMEDSYASEKDVYLPILSLKCVTKYPRQRIELDIKYVSLKKHSKSKSRSEPRIRPRNGERKYLFYGIPMAENFKHE